MVNSGNLKFVLSVEQMQLLSILQGSEENFSGGVAKGM